MSFNFPDRLPPGAVVDDFYEVEGLLGSGGFADVYSGVQRDTGMQIAIKVLRPVYGQSTRVTFEQRFLQEARLAASRRWPPAPADGVWGLWTTLGIDQVFSS